MENILKIEIIKNIFEIREKIKKFKRKNLTIGLIPTMGALHAGHESLIKKAGEECDAVIVSIFANPIQFAPGEDFDKYPQQLELDSQICSKLGVDLIFAPSVKEMYPYESESIENNLTLVVPPLAYQDKLCGKSRPGHFNGVATVVLKLFNIITPDSTYFGRKDVQQLAVITKMTEDLNLPVKIIGCPTVRDSDGMACSSRNRYLSEKSREKAVSIYKALKKIEELYNFGMESSSQAINQSKSLLHPDIELEYFEAIDFETFESIDILRKNTFVAIAAKVDSTRLIDNIII